MPRKSVVIAKASELGSLPANTWRISRQQSQIVLAGAFENRPDRQSWENRLNADFNACGCEESAKGLLLASILAPFVVALWTYMNPALFSWSHAAIWVAAISLFGAIAGKLVGHSKANWKFKTTAADLARIWPSN